MTHTAKLILLALALLPATAFGQLRLHRAEVQYGLANNYLGSGFSLFKDAPTAQRGWTDDFRLAFSDSAARADIGVNIGLGGAETDLHDEEAFLMSLGIDVRYYVGLLPNLKAFYHTGLDLLGTANAYTLASVQETDWRLGAAVRLGIGLEVDAGRNMAVGLSYGLFGGGYFLNGYKPQGAMPDKGDNSFYIQRVQLYLALRF